jgi:hypothetical protein
MHAHIIGILTANFSLAADHGTALLLCAPQHRDEKGNDQGTCCYIKAGVKTVGWNKKVKSIRAPSPAHCTRHDVNARKYGLFTRN